MPGNQKMLYSPEYVKPVYKCSLCNDTGIQDLGEDENGYRIGKRCPCITERAIENRYKNSGIPPAFAEKSFDNFNTDTDLLAMIKNKAMEYVENYHKGGPSLYMCGESGVGKTHLSIAICNELIKKGVNVYYMIYREAISKLKQLFYKDDYEYELEPYKKVELLYIDDLFKGHASDQEKNIMYEIINYRYNYKLPVIISTELGVNGIRALDSATAGRIDEMTHLEGAKNIINFGSSKDRRKS